MIQKLYYELLPLAIDTLSADDYQLVLMTYSFGFSQQKAGETFGISDAAIRKRHKRILAQLYSFYKEQGLTDLAEFQY